MEKRWKGEKKRPRDPIEHSPRPGGSRKGEKEMRDGGSEECSSNQINRQWQTCTGCGGDELWSGLMYDICACQALLYVYVCVCVYTCRWTMWAVRLPFVFFAILRNRTFIPSPQSAWRGLWEQAVCIVFIISLHISLGEMYYSSRGLVQNVSYKCVTYYKNNCLTVIITTWTAQNRFVFLFKKKQNSLKHTKQESFQLERNPQDTLRSVSCQKVQVHSFCSEKKKKIRIKPQRNTTRMFLGTRWYQVQDGTFQHSTPPLEWCSFY